jgi:hypothetical protein
MKPKSPFDYAKQGMMHIESGDLSAVNNARHETSLIAIIGGQQTPATMSDRVGLTEAST